MPGSDADSSAVFRRVSSLAFFAASRARFAVRHLSTMIFAVAGFSSRKVFSPSATVLSVRARISLFPSLVLVCPSNCGSVSLTLIMAVSPSRISSPEREGSFSFTSFMRFA